MKRPASKMVKTRSQTSAEEERATHITSLKVAVEDFRGIRDRFEEAIMALSEACGAEGDWPEVCKYKNTWHRLLPDFEARVKKLLQSRSKLLAALRGIPQEERNSMRAELLEIMTSAKNEVNDGICMLHDDHPHIGKFSFPKFDEQGFYKLIEEMTEGLHEKSEVGEVMNSPASKRRKVSANEV